MATVKDLEQLGTELEKDPDRMLELAKELLRVRGRDGKTLPLIANAAQREFERRRTQQNIVLKARQMGITTWIAARFFLRTITHPGTLTVQVAHTQASVEAIFRNVQRLWEQLPDDLREGPLKRSRANVGQMVFPALDSEFRVWSAADTNAGRGLSIQNLHCSEVSRWPGDAAETLAGLRAALSPGGELVLESTPNGAYGAFYDEWQAGVLTQHFLPWWMESAYVGPAVEQIEWTEAESALAIVYNLSPQQIGFRRHLDRTYGKMRSQEFAEDAETCFRATGDCCFEIEAIERRLAEVNEPFASRRNGALQTWLPPEPGREYLVAVDAAGGGEDGDFAAVQVIDIATGSQCAELQERLRPLELAHAAAELAREYANALLVVERNNQGAAVIAYLQEREKYTRLYKHGREREAEIGWLTSSASKPEMIAHLGAMLVERPNSFRSRRLLGECRTFINADRGKLQAARGAHDDLVMSMGIAQSVRSELLPKLRRKSRITGSAVNTPGAPGLCTKSPSLKPSPNFYGASSRA